MTAGPAPDPQHASDSMLSTFGYREAEVAAQIIVQRAREAKSWDVVVHDADFAGKGLAAEGWGYLKAHRWVEHSGLGWFVTRAFITRVTSKEVLVIDRQNGRKSWLHHGE